MMEMNDMSDENHFFKREDNHLETFTLIWLETNINCDQKHEDIEEMLRSTINHIKKFDDLDKCKKYIEEASKDDKLVLLISGQLGQQLVPLIHQLQHISAIYIYSEDKENDKIWARNFPKLKTIKSDLEMLVSRIIEDHKHRSNTEELVWINMHTTTSDAEGVSTVVNSPFVFSQLLIDCLLRLTSNEMDKNELIRCCKKEYEGNHVELANLNEFQNEYSPEKALWWYTRESFFYKTLNAALCTQNIHMMFLYRSFLTDTYHQLQQCQSKCSVRVYRRQQMSIDALYDLQNYRGQLVSVKSFLSTTRRKPITDFYKDVDTTQQNSFEQVLFEIDADPKVVTTKPFADISKYSDFFLELEVLFMPNSIFRLNTIDYDDNQGWIIGMSLCNDDEYSLKEILGHMKKQNGIGEINLYTFSKMLWKMGKFDQAKMYYIRCVNELSDNDSLLFKAYEDLAEITSQQNNYNESMKWQQKLSDAEKKISNNNGHVNSRSSKKLPGIGSRNTLRCYVFGFIFLFAITLGIGIYLVKYIPVGNGYNDVNQNNPTIANTRTGIVALLEYFISLTMLLSSYN
ncbi:unnamed protein product [Adineta steineri]|uniref:Uncharacterized protein n=1 Tax=Adineta steineri TaxID=433720 RepID=A0A815XYH8_9BILA|nr:unnamed protein product [Adineta steineri]CAF1563313.1 unnamed protein product [Adineta steineri]